MALTINQLMSRFKTIAQTHPNINDFGSGPLYDIQDDFKYPYMWIQNDITHRIEYSEVNKYRAIEYSFVVRIADKVNDNPNVYDAFGENSNNGLEISSDTFTILLDVINAISEDSLGIFTDISLIDDITVEPFFHEDSGDVNGHQAELVLRVENNKPCITPLTP